MLPAMSPCYPPAPLTLIPIWGVYGILYTRGVGCVGGGNVVGFWGLGVLGFGVLFLFVLVEEPARLAEGVSEAAAAGFRSAFKELLKGF